MLILGIVICIFMALISLVFWSFLQKNRINGYLAGLINNNKLLCLGELPRLFNDLLVSNYFFMAMIFVSIFFIFIVAIFFLFLFGKYSSRFERNFIARTLYEKQLYYSTHQHGLKKYPKAAIKFILYLLIVMLFLSGINMIVSLSIPDSLLKVQKISVQIGIVTIIVSVLFLGLWAFLWEQGKFYRIKKRKILLARSSKKNGLLLIAYFVIFLFLIYVFIPVLLLTSNFYIASINVNMEKHTNIIRAEFKKLATDDNIKKDFINKKKENKLSPIDLMAYRNFRYEITKYIPSAFLIFIIFFVILPYLAYSEKKLLLAAASVIASSLTSYMIWSIFPKLFKWGVSNFLIIVPLSIITYIINVYFSAILSDNKI